MTKKNEVSVQSDVNQAITDIQSEAKQVASQLANLGIDASDIIIPLIHVMQNTSELVGAGKAKLGDIVNMTSEQVIGNETQKVDFLPLKGYKTLRVYKADKGGKFVREMPWTDETISLAAKKEGIEEGQAVRYFETLNFLVLLKSELQAGEGFPCLLRFKSSAFRAGRTLATHLYKVVAHFKQPPYVAYVSLTTRIDKKDTNRYGVPVITPPGAKQNLASPEERKEAQKWLAQLEANKYKVDERADKEEEVDAVEAAKPTVIEAEVVEGGEY